MLPVARDARGVGVTAIKGWFLRSALDRSLFCSLQTSYPILPSPNALCHPGLVDVVYRVRGRPRVAPPPPELGDRQWGAKQTKCNGGSPWPDRYGFTRATSIFSQDHCHPTPYPIPPTLNGMNGPKGPIHAIQGMGYRVLGQWTWEKWTSPG